jgi:4-hydroxybenzoate polyprenyltransferase
VIASDDRKNLNGKIKSAALVDRFGERGFSYAGNARADLDIWTHAHDAIVVTARAGLLKRVRSILPCCHHIEGGRLNAALFVKALRLHQWTKNFLIFVPLLTSHQVTSLPLVMRASLAFAAFSLVASSAYVLNDLLDLDADRQDSKKRHRPFASGDLSLGLGLALIPVLLTAGLAAALPFGSPFLYPLLLYFVLTIGYSFSLKRFIFIDVVTLAGLYALRIEAGAAAVGVEISKWLLLFALFIFFSLALVKRYSELRKVVGTPHDQGIVAGRSYRAADLQCISTLGIASGLTAVLVVALYVNGSNVTDLYRNPDLLWFICPLMLYWVSRIWLLTVRGAIEEDPVVFALRDGGSYLVGALTAVIMFLAS